MDWTRFILILGLILLHYSVYLFVYFVARAVATGTKHPSFYANAFSWFWPVTVPVFFVIALLIMPIVDLKRGYKVPR